MSASKSPSILGKKPPKSVQVCVRCRPILPAEVGRGGESSLLALQTSKKEVCIRSNDASLEDPRSPRPLSRTASVSSDVSTTGPDHRSGPGTGGVARGAGGGGVARGGRAMSTHSLLAQAVVGAAEAAGGNAPGTSGGRRRERVFKFDRVFDDSATQDDVFDVVRPLINSVLDGYNATVFAYGQTGAGKTYTMEGYEYRALSTTTPYGSLPQVRANIAGTSPERIGISPRAIETLYRVAGTRKLRYEFRCSFLQLYNECVYDLLDPSNPLATPSDATPSGTPSASGVRTDGPNGQLGPGLRVRWAPEEEFYVEGLSVKECKGPQAMQQFYETGVRHKYMSSHLHNLSSSRSHCMFIIYVTAYEKHAGDTNPSSPSDTPSISTSTPSTSTPSHEKVMEGRLTLVDLAGSERIANIALPDGSAGLVTGAGNNNGDGDDESVATSTITGPNTPRDRLLQRRHSTRMVKESIDINSSLFVLSKVISALATSDRSGGSQSLSRTGSRSTVHVPYRDSKLTRLLKNSLGGNCFTVMIACLNPLDQFADENLSTLVYASRASKIKNRPVVNEDPKVKLIRELRLEVKQLKKELSHLQRLLLGDGVAEREGEREIGPLEREELMKRMARYHTASQAIDSSSTSPPLSSSLWASSESGIILGDDGERERERERERGREKGEEKDEGAGKSGRKSSKSRRRRASIGVGVSPSLSPSLSPHTHSQPLPPPNPASDVLSDKLADSVKMIKQLVGINVQLRNGYDGLAEEKSLADETVSVLMGENAELRQRLEALERGYRAFTPNIPTDPRSSAPHTPTTSSPAAIFSAMPPPQPPSAHSTPGTVINSTASTRAQTPSDPSVALPRQRASTATGLPRQAGVTGGITTSHPVASALGTSTGNNNTTMMGAQHPIHRLTRENDSAVIYEDGLNHRGFGGEQANHVIQPGRERERERGRGREREKAAEDLENLSDEDLEVYENLDGDGRARDSGRAYDPHDFSGYSSAASTRPGTSEGFIWNSSLSLSGTADKPGERERERERDRGREGEREREVERHVTTASSRRSKSVYRPHTQGNISPYGSRRRETSIGPTPPQRPDLPMGSSPRRPNRPYTVSDADRRGYVTSTVPLTTTATSTVPGIHDSRFSPGPMGNSIGEPGATQQISNTRVPRGRPRTSGEVSRPSVGHADVFAALTAHSSPRASELTLSLGTNAPTHPHGVPNGGPGNNFGEHGGGNNALPYTQSFAGGMASNNIGGKGYMEDSVREDSLFLGMNQSREGRTRSSSLQGTSSTSAHYFPPE